MMERYCSRGLCLTGASSTKSWLFDHKLARALSLLFIITVYKSNYSKTRALKVDSRDPLLLQYLKITLWFTIQCLCFGKLD